MPRVSVIIPTYNRGHYIGQAIDSVLAQTFVDFECIVIDDGSTDNTGEVVARYGSRVRYLQQAHSGRPAVARNTGLRVARGEYIAFLDSDDIWLPDKLARQISVLEMHHQVGLVFHNAYLLKDDQSDGEELYLQGKTLPAVARLFAELYQGSLILTPTAMVRRSCFDRVGFFDESLLTAEDIEMWLRIAAQFDIAFLDQPLAKVRRHKHSLSRQAVTNQRWRTAALQSIDARYPDLVRSLGWLRRRVHGRFHFAVGRAYLWQNKVDSAREQFQESVRWNPLHPGPYLFWLASLNPLSVTAIQAMRRLKWFIRGRYGRNG